MEIMVITLLVPKRELFDTWVLEPLIGYLTKEDLRPSCVASSSYCGALRAALEIQYTYDTAGTTIAPIPEVSDSAHGHGKGFDGPIALRKALAATPCPKNDTDRPLIVVVTESRRKIAQIYQWIGTGEKPRPCPDFGDGDFVIMVFNSGVLKSLTLQTASKLAAVS